MKLAFSFQRFCGYLQKEVKQIIRDPSTLLISFFLPLLMIFVFGYGISLDVDRMRLGVVLEEASEEAQSLTSAFLGSHSFQPEIGYTHPLFNKKLVQGEIRCIVTIPKDFSRKVLNGKTASLQVILDGSEPNMAMMMRNAITTVVNTWVSQNFSQKASMIQPGRSIFKGADERHIFMPNAPRAIDEIAAPSLTSPPLSKPQILTPILAEQRVWFNPSLKSRDVLLPGSIAIILSLIGTLLTALVVAREWDRGTMEAILATPLRMSEMFLAKLLPYFFLGLGSMLLCVVISLLLFDVPFRGSFFILLLTTSIFLIASLGQGLLISSKTRSQFVSCQIAIMLGFLPAFSLSGFVFEIQSMPWIIQMLTYLFPPRYFVTLLQSIFLSGTGGDLLFFNLGMMGLMALFFFGIALWTTRKRLD